MKRFVLCLFAVAGLLAAPARAADIGLITHDAAERKSSVTIRVTGQLKVLLPGRNQPNHRWQIVSNDPRIIKSVGEPKPAGAPKESKDAKAAVGAAPWEVTFVAQRPGRSILRFVWAKDGETDTATPEEYREVTVRVEPFLQ